MRTAASDCAKDAGSFELRYGKNLFGQNGSPGGCVVFGTDIVLAGAIGTALLCCVLLAPAAFADQTAPELDALFTALAKGADRAVKITGDYPRGSSSHAQADAGTSLRDIFATW